jgi:hypothetical protein
MKLEQPPTNEQHTTAWRKRQRRTEDNERAGDNGDEQEATRAFLGIPFPRSRDHLLFVLPCVVCPFHYLSSAQVGW